jgi:NADPH:quinone reductase-like Zn-dependent oxidoreductase
MLAAAAVRQSATQPLSGLEVGPVPEPEPREGWVVVEVKAAALNRHDLFSLEGVGLPAERLPMILGCDAAGVDDEGNEVIVHAVVARDGWSGDETLDPERTLLSELHPGTLAERVAVPRRNLVPKPPELSWEQAACLPTAWLTAYRMLFTRGRVLPGETVLVQGAGGGVATALIQLGAAAGVRVWVTSRSAEKRERALALGAEIAVEPGARLPRRVDAVMETIGRATWPHSIRSVKAGGTVVVAGATAGDADGAMLQHVFFRQLSILGSTMGTREELERLTSLLVATGVRPLIDRVLPLGEARRGLEALAGGDVFGKIVLKA